MFLKWIIMLCQTLFLISLQGTRPIVTLYAHDLGASPFFIGLLVSSFAFLPMLFSIQIGKWLDVFGARKMTLFGAAGMLIALIFPVLTPSFIGLFINQLIIGVSFVCILVSLQKTIGNIKGDRDKLIASFSVAVSLGESIGPLTTGVLFSHFGFRFTFITMTIPVIIGGIISYLSLGNVSKSETIKPLVIHSIKETLSMLKQSNLRKALIISGLVLYSKDIFIAYFPLYGDYIGLSPSQIGVVISTLLWMSMLIRFSQFSLVLHFGRGKVMVVSLLVSGVAFSFFPITDAFFLLILFSLFLGAGLGLGQPLSIVYILNESPSERHGEVLGLRLTFNRASQFIAPLIFGWIGLLAGITPVFLVSGGMLLIGSYFTRSKED